jgi:hypothetical protein
MATSDSSSSSNNHNHNNFHIAIDEHWCCIGDPRYHDPIHTADLRLSIYDCTDNKRLALIANNVIMFIGASRVVTFAKQSKIGLPELRAEWQRTGIVITGIAASDLSAVVLQPAGISLLCGAYAYVLDRATFCLSLSWILFTLSVEIDTVIVCQ